MVEHSGFREFMQLAQPLFKVPSRNTIRADILKQYEGQKTTLVESMNRSASRVALTTDMWTSFNGKKGYMAITAHFVDNNWSLHNLILRFIYVPAPHTALALSKEMLKCVLDWNLERKVSTVTVDNCSTNDALINNMFSKLNRKHLLFGGKFFHMRCCAHILNLIVQDGLKVMGNGLERVRDSVGLWLATPKRQQLFKESATHLGIEYSKQLVQDCKTQWNSTYLVLSVALQYKDVFYRLKQQEFSFLCAPFEQDWELAENICDKLKVFYKASNVFYERKYPTSNVFFLFMFEIKVNLCDWVESTDLVIANIAKSMLAKFDKYWEVVHGILAVANVLDPRYKLGVIQFFFQTFYGDKAASEIERVKTYCNDLCRDYECSSIATSSSKHVQSVVGGENLTKGDPVRDKLKTFMESATHLAETSELDLYLEAKRSPFDDDLDVLSWWQTKGKKYPTLRNIDEVNQNVMVDTTSFDDFVSPAVVLAPRAQPNPPLDDSDNGVAGEEEDDTHPVRELVGGGTSVKTVDEEFVDKIGVLVAAVDDMLQFLECHLGQSSRLDTFGWVVSVARKILMLFDQSGRSVAEPHRNLGVGQRRWMTICGAIQTISVQLRRLRGRLSRTSQLNRFLPLVLV
ncbi:zinc finger BED domain-containing protein RICESLEEPER 2-like [Ipomoea triloba]|uniref:zinc finger BED domain-containing protein RICESLEEPER 2-like n=1 Tax=Ipomoea triloba TaxID=35885 RepID=UPI00125DBA23|nr:zinc finger BED domain-containing protein RICESLEEPER 2-like [Ipomoea triloba]